MAYIYKIINDVNGKFYIGQTSRSLQIRFSEHKEDMNKRDYEKRPLYSAMKKYGVEHFHIELVEETENPNEKEVYWIEKLRPDYNASAGGEGRPLQWTEDDIEQLIIMFNSKKYTIKYIAEYFGHDEQTISLKLTSLGFNIDTHRLLKMPVYQIDKNTNEIINEFESTHDAARILFNDDTKNAHIRECCRGLRKTAYGYKWSFIENYKEM